MSTSRADRPSRIEAADVRRAFDHPLDLIAKLGLEGGMKRQAGGALVLCPHHAERHASCSVTRGPDGIIRIECHGCGWSGDETPTNLQRALNKPPNEGATEDP